MARPEAHNNSRIVIAAGFIFTAAALAFWPLLFVGIPLLLIGGALREGERYLRERQRKDR